MRIGCIGTGTIAAAGPAIVVSGCSHNVSARFGNMRAAGNPGVVEGAGPICVARRADRAEAPHDSRAADGGA